MIRLGTDIVYIPRIQEALSRFGHRFLQRVYTPSEQQDCGYGQNTSCRPSIHRLAGRWAAKKAIAKALETRWRGVGYTDIEIIRLPSGAPTVSLHRRAAAIVSAWQESQWQLSLSHDGDYAVATVLLVYSKAPPSNLGDGSVKKRGNEENKM
ncbi:MAG: holo-ACP synthase [Chroococcidiopsidaceae cyanobacterium CP_BM_ER_R8_30]|nr:holo-ACP synthase [Chroococcidiopsidaceae cyanobacterium CP_BM_ER_R8_30]